MFANCLCRSSFTLRLSFGHQWVVWMMCTVTSISSASVRLSVITTQKSAWAHRRPRMLMYAKCRRKWSNDYNSVGFVFLCILLPISYCRNAVATIVYNVWSLNARVQLVHVSTCSLHYFYQVNKQVVLLCHYAVLFTASGYFLCSISRYCGCCLHLCR